MSDFALYQAAMHIGKLTMGRLVCTALSTNSLITAQQLGGNGQWEERWLCYVCILLSLVHVGP